MDHLSKSIGALQRQIYYEDVISKDGIRRLLHMYFLNLTVKFR
jgi:hypothetical protein